MNRRAVLHAFWFALAIAIFSSVWLVVMRVTGWYCDPDKMELGIAVPIVEIILLVLASLQLLRDGCKVWARIGLCIAMTLVAAILTAGFAYVYTSSQDGYFDAVQQAHTEGLRQMGKTETEIATMVTNHQLATPKGFAVYRFRNTVVYGVIGTLLGLLATIRPLRSPPTRST